MNDPVRPRDLDRLDGHEPLVSGQTVLDFWSWALGDLRMNTARGYLVEYLVATALGDPSPIRIEWGPHDVMAADGTLVEVKTTGYLQSWTTKKLSTPKWSFKAVASDKIWSEDVGADIPVEPADRVHVWVFALQTCREPEQYDPLDIDKWRFRVVPHRELLATKQTSAGLSFFDRLGIDAVTYADLPSIVSAARAANDRFPIRP